MNNIIATVANTYHWTPHYLESLYVDGYNHFGLEFWYDQIKEQVKDTK